MRQHYRDIYRLRADDYQRLVAREDHRGALLPAIRAVHPLEGARVVELGAGTGRLTRLLAPWAAQIAAYDSSAAMLEVAARENEAHGVRNATLAVAEHHALPAEDHSADLVVEGWAFGHLMDQRDWRSAVDAALAEVDSAMTAVQQAQRSGNFAQYGEALQRLDEAMGKFDSAK